MSLATGQQVGRFVLLELLGRGAQAEVWRAHDPQLQREVALKCLHPSAEGASGVSECLAEARLAAGLGHPGIVPVHDVVDVAGVQAIVSECVQGQTLAACLREHGRLAPREAAQCLREILDALAHAHGQGVIHRDLKASNVMRAADGRVRVMDFGIAARLGGPHDGRIVGSPSTISPEAAAGQAPQPAMDIFAAGMLLGELLTGAPLRPCQSPELALAHALHQPVCWPADCEADVDDLLRAIVLRATAREPGRRWDSAVAMRQALDDWLQPADPADPAAPAVAQHSTLGFLLRRMRLHGDFPALSNAVLRIQRITSSESESLQALSAEVMSDVALTQRLLRVVNSARFRCASAGEVTTVSRAAALVGFGGIRTLALSLVLLEHMGNRAHAERMKGLFLEALLTATLVDELTPPSSEREEAFLAGMFSQLGRLLVEYYLPDEAQRIRSATGALSERCEIDVLGLSYAALGQGVAGHWGLPWSLRQRMSVPTGEPPQRRLGNPLDATRWRVRAATELVQSLLAGDTQHSPAIEATAERYTRPLGLGREALLSAVQTARSHLGELAAGLGLQVAPKARAARLLQAAPEPTLTLTLVEPDVQAQAVLNAGVAEVAAALAAAQVDRGQVLHSILATLQQALHFDRLVLALKDPQSPCLLGRLAQGEGAQALCAQLRVDLRGVAGTDLVAAACLKGLDTLIDDAGATRLQPSLPAWLRERLPRSFLLLPLQLRGAPFGLLYADRLSRPVQLGEAELSLLRTLRNQAVLAFKT